MRRGILVLPLLMGVGAALASPYTMPRGTTSVTFLGSYWSIESYFGGNGDEADLPLKITQTDLILSIEHGLSDRITWSTTLPYSRSKLDISGQPSSVNQGASDATMNFKFRLSPDDGAWAYAVVAGVKWPGDYKPDLPNSPGDGNFDAELVGTVGRQLGALTLTADAGYRFRHGNPANELLFRFQPSYLIGERLILFGNLDVVNSLSGLTFEQVAVEGKGVFSQLEEDSTRLGGGVYYSFSNRLGAFAALTQTVAGHSTAHGVRWTLGTKISF